MIYSAPILKEEKLYFIYCSKENEANKIILEICSGLLDGTLEQFFVFPHINPKCAMNEETFFPESLKLE